MTVLLVNGTEREVVTHPNAALLWALRDELACASAKYGCGVEQCGACRVLIDGAPAASCAVSVGEAAGHEIVTLEELVISGRAGPVVEAMVGVDAGQCGYCLPGIVTTLVALQERSVAPTRAELLRALDVHLCRCGTQTRIIAAAAAALGVADG